MQPPPAPVATTGRPGWSPDRRMALWKALAWCQLAFGLALTGYAWMLVQGDVTAHARARFDFRVSEILTALRDRVTAYELALGGGLALFNAVGDVSREQWQAFAATMDLNANYPGIQGLGYSPAIFPDTREAHVAAMRAQGFPDYAIRPPGDRDAYTPVVYLEPDTGLNKKAFGFDTFSEAVRRAAIERARDTAKPSITGKITLVQEGTTNVQPGFIMFMPVYGTPAPPPTVELRRRLIKGYVNAPFRLYNLMRGILASDHQDVGFEIFDGDAPSETALLYRSEGLADDPAKPGPPLFADTRRLEILGRTWTIRFAALPGFEAAMDRRLPVFITASGLAITLLLFVIIRALLAARAGVELLERTRQHESDLLQGILGNFPAPYLLVDASQRVLQTNARFLEMLDIDGPVEGLTGKHLAEVYYRDPAHETMAGKSIAEGVIFQGVEVNTKSHKGRDKVILANISPLYDINNACIGGLCIYVDLTERRQMEIKLARVGKLEAIGQLAAGIAHEINTPTQYVGDGVTFLRNAFEDLCRVLALVEDQAGRPEAVGEAPARAMRELLEDIDAAFLRAEIPAAIDNIFDGISRITSIVAAMRRFSHSSGDRTQAVNLADLARATLEISRNEWKYVAEADLDSDPDLPDVRCQADEISQVLLNIVINAAHAVAEAAQEGGAPGRIGLRLRRVGDMAEIAVSDTGAGIPEAIRDKVFNMFFTTKDVGKGTGQGLAIAYDIVVAKHGGSLTFESEPGRGTTFFVRLPIDGDDNGHKG